MLYALTITKFDPKCGFLLLEGILTGVVQVLDFVDTDGVCRAQKWTTAIAGLRTKEISGRPSVPRPRSLTSPIKGTRIPVMVRAIFRRRLRLMVIPCGAPRYENVRKQRPRAETLHG